MLAKPSKAPEGRKGITRPTGLIEREHPITKGKRKSSRAGARVGSPAIRDDLHHLEDGDRPQNKDLRPANRTLQTSATGST